MGVAVGVGVAVGSGVAAAVGVGGTGVGVAGAMATRGAAVGVRVVVGFAPGWAHAPSSSAVRAKMKGQRERFCMEPILSETALAA